MCNEEMRVYGEPSVNVQPITKLGEKFPIKLVANLMTVYECIKCPVKAVYTENKDYLPNYPDVMIDSTKEDI